MDEQRFQAYVALIEDLLACPQGKEGAVLQAKAELVDVGLVKVVQQLADRLEIQGNINAGWLRQFAKQLTQALAIVGKNSTGSVSQSSRSFLLEIVQLIVQIQGDPEQVNAARSFLLEIVQLIVQTQGDSEQVNEFFRNNLSRLSQALLVVLPDVFEELIQQLEQTLTVLIFELFGSLIIKFPLGTHWLNVELGIAAYQQVLAVRTDDAMPVEWASTMNALAVAYFKRIQGDRAENIEQAIITFKKALTVMTQASMPLEWSDTIINLANAYCFRIRGDRAENIEQAIMMFKKALIVVSETTMPIKWAAIMNNLAIAHMDRIRGDRVENIEQAIMAYQKALTVRTEMVRPVEWSDTMMNLAIAYYKRIRGNRAENIEQAITAYQKALTVMTQASMPLEWSDTMDNLASAYVERIRGDRADNIEQAISAYQQALMVRTEATMPLAWANTMNNLASAYCFRIRGNRADNIEQAIAAYQQALMVRTKAAMPLAWADTTNNLAITYSMRLRGNRADNIEKAVAAYQAALTVVTPKLLPNECRMTGRSLGNLYLEQRRWSEAADTYRLALQAAETLYQNAYLLDSKSAELSENQTLFRNAAYAYARNGNLTLAIETLEQGRARGLSESLDRDRANLEALQAQSQTLYNQYKEITQQLRNLEAEQRNLTTSADRHTPTPESLRNTAIALRQQLNHAIEQIRQIPGYSNFLSSPTFSDITTALRPNNPLLYLVTTPNGSLALIVESPDKITPLWFDRLTEPTLLELLQTWFTAYNQQFTDHQAWLDTIDTTLRQLWDLLMGTIVNHLQTHNFTSATLIPTGLLSLLPLHAAWTEAPNTPTNRHYAIDAIHFTYAPNARSLTAAQAIAEQVQAHSILAIENPTQDLKFCAPEVQAAIATFPNHQVLRHTEATVDAVLKAIDRHSILHLSCHGTANFDTPLQSGLLMSNGLLTLDDLLELNLTDSPTNGLRLAILSACETGLPGLENLDEVVSLPVGLLQAGVAGVIASLWSVSDISTMMLLSRFYDFWRKDSLPPDQALRQAQQWIHRTTDGEKAEYFDLRWPSARKNDRTYAHPFHWAAFSYLGV